ncbi:MAG TPA: MarR family winged helix-turn-helix transcriptional regulator [Solirubrobacteraceae bacterium]|nr:MarR family winged helix-turn-helix transcriptional regulator [Solirubrobacteraceae bacterium]
MAAASVGADPRPPEPEPGAAGAGRVDGGDERAIRECSAGLARALKGAIAAARRLRGRETQRAGEVAHAQYALLFELAERDELTAGELAAAADLAPATVTGMLDHLVAAGLVDRGRPERDRRLVVCRLTDAGRARVAARRARLEPLWNAAIAEFDPRELGIATAVLDRLRIFFETLDEADGQP